MQGRTTLRSCNVGRAFGIGSGRALSDGCAKVAAVAHEEEGGNRFKRVQQAEHAALALAHCEGKRFKERAFECYPIGGGVHFVFGEFEFAVADIFVREEFDFLEPNNLGAD